MNEELDQRLKRAFQLYDDGVALFHDGRLDEAERVYRECLELNPHDERAWFNLGLIYKRWRRWADCLRCNREVVRLDPSDEGAWWNLGIAATALRDWPTARQAWRGCGIAVPEDDGPIEMQLGLTPIRLDPDGIGEVVWGERIDPARGIIRNVPSGRSGYHFGDIVLHDGEPVGERTVNGRAVPVFDALELWERSTIPTLHVEVVAPSRADSDALIELFDSEGYAAEDWTRSMRKLDPEISRASAPEFVEQADWQPQRDFGIAAPLEVAHRVLTVWRRGRPGRDHDSPHRAEP